MVRLMAVSILAMGVWFDDDVICELEYYLLKQKLLFYVLSC
jgi:hypothetical protein